MTRPVDVMARTVERLRSPHPDHAQDAANNAAAIALHEYSAAVAELIEADREYDAAVYALYRTKGVEEAHVAHRKLADAKARRAAALANVGGAS